MNVLYPDNFDELELVHQFLLQYYLQKKEYAKIAKVIFENQYPLIVTEDFSDGGSHSALIAYLREDLRTSQRSKVSGKRKTGFFGRYSLLGYNQVETHIPSLVGSLLDSFLIGVSIIANCNVEKQDQQDYAIQADAASYENSPF